MAVTRTLAASALLLVAQLLPAGGRADADIWTVTGDLGEARFDATTTLLADGAVLVAGGRGGGLYVLVPLATAERYDPATGTWATTGSMLEGRFIAAAVRLADGRVLVTGGVGGGGSLASAEIYDPVAGSWAVAAPMSTWRNHHTATRLADGRVLVAGGAAHPFDGYLASAEIYHPATGTWAWTGSMALSRAMHTATLLPDGRVLVVGGEGEYPSYPFPDSAEIYDPTTGLWSAAPGMSDARAGHSATLLSDGRVLVAGGLQNHDGCGGQIAGAEVYTPATGTWSPTGALNQRRQSHLAALLPDGRVPVAGGVDTSTCTGLVGGTTSAEVYDPGTGAWTPTASLNEPRHAPVGGLLSDGRVLAAGGVTRDGAATRSAEVFGLPVFPIAVDIRPGACPNPLNVHALGMLPVAIAGTPDFDVTQVDPGTVRLAGIPPLRFAFEDVATPFLPFTDKAGAFACTAAGADGTLDLTLTFDAEAVTQALGPVGDRDEIRVPLEARLGGGTPLTGEDIVLILKPGKR